MCGHALGRYRRLRGQRALEETLRAGKVERTPYFTLRYRDGEGPPGVAFLAGRRVGKAVRRNRAKRVLREAFRRTELDLSGIATLVFVATDRAATAPYADIRNAVAAALRRVSDRVG